MYDVHMPTRPEIRDLIKLARAAHWQVDQTSNSHWRFVGPTGQKVFVPSTPSDHRSHRNVRAKLRRAGLEVPR